MKWNVIRHPPVPFVNSSKGPPKENLFSSRCTSVLIALKPDGIFHHVRLIQMAIGGRSDPGDDAKNAPSMTYGHLCSQMIAAYFQHANANCLPDECQEHFL